MTEKNPNLPEPMDRKPWLSSQQQLSNSGASFTANSSGRAHRNAAPVKKVYPVASNSRNATAQPQQQRCPPTVPAPNQSGRRFQQGRWNAQYAVKSCDRDKSGAGRGFAKQIASAGAQSARPFTKKSQLRYEKYESSIAGYGQRAAGKHHGVGSFHGTNRPSNANYSKEQYLQANCQFVVIDDQMKYAAHLVDPDLFVDWENIEELRMSTAEPPICPICLYPPVAAKITRCGHVYCWPCLLHYLALSDKNWRKCPICFESVYVDQLKSFVSVPVSAVRVDDVIELELMCRQRGSLIVRPFHSATDALPEPDQPAFYGDALAERFAKLLVADCDSIGARVIERERKELRAKYAADKDEPESCFVVAALNELDERATLLRDRTELQAMQGGDSLPSNHKRSECQSQKSSDFGPAAHKNQICSDPPPTMFEWDAFNDTMRSIEQPLQDDQGDPDQNADGAEHDVAVTSTVNHEKTDYAAARGQRRLSSGTDHEHPHTYYFYQAVDGQPVYLHPVNARALLHEFGTLAHAPHVLRLRVLETQHVLMTDAVRHRYRYLTHVPLGTLFTLVEVEMNETLVSPGTLHAFAGEFARRATARRRRARSDTRRQHRAQQLDRALLLDPMNYAKYVEKEDLDDDDFPSIQVVASAQCELQQLWTTAPEGDSAPSASSSSPVDTAVSVGSPSSLPSPPSFAQMLRQGKPKPASAVRPTLSNKEGGVKEPGEGGGKGTNADDDEPQMPAPTYADAWGDAVHDALSRLDNQPGSSASATNNSDVAKSSNKKKNKRKKQVVLFST